jgi:hypothetical protein
MRRLLAASLLAAAAVTLYVAAPALSTGPWAPAPVRFSNAVRLPVRATAAALRAAPVVTTVSPGKRFDLVGLRWSGAASPRAWIRTARDGGYWSSWIALDTGGGDAPDGAVLRASAPVWVGGADRLQLRVARAASGMRAEFINTTGTATALDRLRNGLRSAVHTAMVGLFATPLADAAASRPAIIPRSSWDPSNSCRPRASASYGRVDMAIVHHTESANDYGRADSAAIVRAICLFHRDDNGWNDIGYNFLVDRYGQVFEGRAGGTTRAVIGAHAQGYNSFSTGISVIGSFMTDPAPAAALRATARLISWRLGIAHVPVSGHITEVSGGGPLNAHPAGEHIRFNRIAGHRDGDATDCPGDDLYAQLPELRRLAAAYGTSAALTTLTASASPPLIPFLTKARISGTLSFGDGASPRGRTIVIEARGANGRWVPVARAKAAGDGTWSAQLALSHDTTFQAVYGGDGLHPRAVSQPLSVNVLPLIHVRAAPKHVRSGDLVRVTGTISPRKPALVVTVMRKLGPGRYVAVAHRRVSGRSGRWSLDLKLRHATLYRFDVESVADRANAAGRAHAFARAIEPPHGGGGVAP